MIFKKGGKIVSAGILTHCMKNLIEDSYSYSNISQCHLFTKEIVKSPGDCLGLERCMLFCLVWQNKKKVSESVNSGLQNLFFFECGTSYP